MKGQPNPEVPAEDIHAKVERAYFVPNYKTRPDFLMDTATGERFHMVPES